MWRFKRNGLTSNHLQHQAKRWGSATGTPPLVQDPGSTHVCRIQVDLIWHVNWSISIMYGSLHVSFTISLQIETSQWIAIRDYSWLSRRKALMFLPFMTIIPMARKKLVLDLTIFHVRKINQKKNSEKCLIIKKCWQFNFF